MTCSELKTFVVVIVVVFVVQCFIVFLSRCYNASGCAFIALLLCFDRALTLLYRAFILVRIRAFIAPLKWMFL